MGQGVKLVMGYVCLSKITFFEVSRQNGEC